MENIKGVDWVYVMNPKLHNDNTVISSKAVKTQMDERTRRMGRWNYDFSVMEVMKESSSIGRRRCV